eukprot:175279_1
MDQIQLDTKEDNLSNLIKQEYFGQLRSKLSTFAKMDKFIQLCVQDIHQDIKLPSDIIRAILLFYMYDLSKYECVAIFTVKDAQTKGHLSAFNVTNRAKYHTSHSLLQHQNRCDMDSKNANLFKDVYGTSFRIFSLNRFPSNIRDNLFPKYTRIASSDLDLHVLFRIESTFERAMPIKASLIETDDQILLSDGITAKNLDRCDLIQSSVHGLVALGGNSSAVFVLQWNKDKHIFEWNEQIIAPMNITRYNQRSVFLDRDEKIFVCGGNSGSRSVELYDFASNKWSKLPMMRVSRDCHGCIYDGVNTKCVYALAAYNTCRESERYDFTKNKWFDLPPLNDTHRWNPAVKMMDNNNVLVIGGDFYQYQKGWGGCEYLDLRDSANRWVRMGKYIVPALGFDADSHFQNKQMRGIWYLFT